MHLTARNHTFFACRPERHKQSGSPVQAPVRGIWDAVLEPCSRPGYGRVWAIEHGTRRTRFGLDEPLPHPPRVFYSAVNWWSWARGYLGGSCSGRSSYGSKRASKQFPTANAPVGWVVGRCARRLFTMSLPIWLSCVRELVVGSTAGADAVALPAGDNWFGNTKLSVTLPGGSNEVSPFCVIVCHIAVSSKAKNVSNGHCRSVLHGPVARYGRCAVPVPCSR